MLFTDRRDAGRQLAARLEYLRGRAPVVVGLPRGGVPVAAEVAEALSAPLDICVIRKLGVPVQPELALGAIGEGGVRVISRQVMRLAGVTTEQLAAVEERERAELDRRVRRYRAGRPAVELAGRTVVVVDDGVATGSTAQAACRIVRARGAARVVLAVPVAPSDWAATLGAEADELVCVRNPLAFYAIGQFYQDFEQTADAEVMSCLEQAAARAPAGPTGTAMDGSVDGEVELTAGGVRLGGLLTVPTDARGVVVFAHGSGSSRYSPRNRFVAERLNRAGLATLLFDLLSEDEAADRGNVFDIDLMTGRLAEATRWLRSRPEAAALAVGYFGASTGAAAALRAAAEPGSEIAAVVSRGGRPDLAGPELAEVKAPTLLIVGGHDRLVLGLNRQAQAHLRCESRLAVVPGATHLFEEPGTLAAAADLAADWFTAHLSEF